MANEPRQEVGATGFHDEAAAAEDEADFRAAVANADVHRERHCDSYSDSGALEGADGGFAAVEYGEGDSSATVNVVLANHFILPSISRDHGSPLT